MLPRFYAPGAERAGTTIELPDDEAQHLTRVLRLKTGAPIRVFNGRGNEFDAAVETTKSRVRAHLTTAHNATPEPRVAVTLAQAILKADKMDDVVRDAVMIGVAAIQPMLTTRTEVTLSTVQRGKRAERWHRIAVSSAKQCGRAVVPSVLEPRSFGDVVGSLTAMSLPGPGIMLVEPSASSEALSLRELADASAREATILIGPEGGWTPEEVEHGSTACRLVTLGARTLRADAAGVIALSALFAIWGEL